VRLESVGAPDALNRTHAQPRRLRHQDARPVAGLAWRVSERQCYDALGRLRAQRLNARGTRLIAKQAVEPVLHKTFLPPPNAGLGFAGLPHNLARADAIGGQQHDLRPPSVFLTRVSILNEASEPTDIDR